VASKVVNQGLKMIGDRASGVAGAAAAIAGMSFDDSANAFAAADTAANSGGAITNFQGSALDSTPTGSAATTPYVVTHLCTLTTGQLNGATVKRFAAHNSSTPTASSTTLISGVDGFSFAKTSSFSMTPTYKHSYS
jgi:hypothetical protein